ncbi:Holliday junction resolvase RuvX [Nocardia jinanensis]|uniref:Putative pre-16S rRNA nuclease n=1 Tax=Nocardia jinanensis TaxID=382504 RepID=A0A917R7U8_9NOCA|nr:Holliday junction resolvase RuvX [Nocardia jinanensis]GGK93897.1 putative pre-16S rRNA nuclease [Nocardia jinanensis]
MAVGSQDDPLVDRPDPVSDPGRGRRLGIDVGSVRIGVAASDPDGILATPVETVPRDTGARRAGRRSPGAGRDTRTGGSGPGPGTDIARIAAIAQEYEAVEIIVGLPRTLRGEKGTSARMATEFAGRLRDSLPEVPIRLSDERLTTVSAARALRDSGVRARGQRQVIDQAAAVSILQSWLDERSSVMRSAEDAARIALSGDDE